MMNKQELKQKLKETFEPIFKKQGFTKIDAKGQGVSFKRKTVVGFDELLMASSNYGGLYPTGFVISKISKVLGEIQYSAAGVGDNLNGNIIIWYNYRNFANLNSYNIVDIETDADIEEFKEKVLNFMDKAGWDFINGYNSLEELEKVINTDDESTYFYQEDTCLRAEYGIILAKLVGNPRYDVLVEKYRKQLISWPAKLQVEYEKVVLYLDSEEFVEEYLKL